MAESGDTTWRMSDEQRGLMPEVSGNAINGLGEGDFRRPSIVYWPNGRAFDSLPHGELCKFMGRHQSPEVRAVFRDTANRAPLELDPVAGTKVEATPEDFTARTKAFALAHEADLVGVAGLDPDWFYDQYTPPELPWVVAIGGKMAYDPMAAALPTMADDCAAIEVGLAYNQVDRAAGALANWIRGQGYAAEKQGGPSSGEMALVPAAIACGLGELGKHGSIINRELGSLLRLSAVRTDMPLVADRSDQFGADRFCANCQACSRACPPDALFDHKQMVRGEAKWYVDFDKCVPYFNEHQGCGACLVACPWSRPGVAQNLLAKMARRRRTGG